MLLSLLVPGRSDFKLIVYGILLAVAGLALLAAGIALAVFGMNQ